MQHECQPFDRKTEAGRSVVDGKSPGKWSLLASKRAAVT